MSKPNAWKLTGLSAIGCAIWTEAFYFDHWRKIYDRTIVLRGGDSFMTWEDFCLDKKVGSEESRRNFMTFLGILEDLQS